MAILAYDLIRCPERIKGAGVVVGEDLNMDKKKKFNKRNQKK